MRVVNANQQKHMGQHGSIVLVMDQISPAVVEFQRPQQWGWPTGMPELIRWANDFAAANLQTEKFPKRKSCGESTQQLWGYSDVRKDRRTDGRADRVFYPPLLSLEKGEGVTVCIYCMINTIVFT